MKPAASLAKRFAAKEAAWKALGDEQQIGINWKDMGVRNNKSGKPFLELKGKAAEQLKKLTPENMVARIDLSLSDELVYAQAFVIISAENEQKNLQDNNQSRILKSRFGSSEFYSSITAHLNIRVQAYLLVT